MTLADHVEDSEMPPAHRSWTGNDTSQREQHERVRIVETPLFLHLSWRKDRTAQPVPVANLKLDLPGLLAGHYIRKDGDGHARLRFFHDDDGSICIQTKSGEPRLVVGHART